MADDTQYPDALAQMLEEHPIPRFRMPIPSVNVPLPAFRSADPQYGTFDNKTGQRVPDAQPPQPPTVMQSVGNYMSRYDPRTIAAILRAYSDAFDEYRRSRADGGSVIAPMDALVQLLAKHYGAPAAADTIYADQKIGVMPSWVWLEGLPERRKP